MSTVEIVVLAFAIVMFGGLVALLIYVERPGKAENQEGETKRPQ